MIDRSDWEIVYQHLIRDERERRGELPPVEELVAYTEGKLPTEKAEQVQEFLAIYPELAQDLGRPVSEPRPGDPDYASDRELEDCWADLEAKLALETDANLKRTGAKRGWRIAGLQLATLAAAALVVVLGWLYWGALGEIDRLEIELGTPQPNPEIRHLLPDGRRGDASLPTIDPGEQRFFLLRLSLISDVWYPDYHLRVLRLVGGTEIELWETSRLQRRNSTFEIWVPRSFLGPGEYRLELGGISETGRSRTLLATYTFRLTGPPSR